MSDFFIWSMQDTNPMQAIAVRFSFCGMFSNWKNFVHRYFFYFFDLIWFGPLFCRLPRTPPSPSLSSDSSVWCVWWSCSIVQRVSATCYGRSSSPSRWATCFHLFFVGLSHHTNRWLELCGFVSLGSTSRSSAHSDALLHLRCHWDAGITLMQFVFKVVFLCLQKFGHKALKLSIRSLVRWP